ncbi:hypothetical protein K466DRAFT_409174 [Polyporus arcularius HHB13444]|uniref:Uncharacterized protein n=1 Tax=Polyporus arcularius HHB13444 TaxID=1314778 RepID=A0A5C3PKE1_9APHY|nr:hypothetical protein K466DRAFT_409174 [Polyporus arcularius HHB13444]
MSEISCRGARIRKPDPSHGVHRNQENSPATRLAASGDRTPSQTSIDEAWIGVGQPCTYYFDWLCERGDNRMREAVVARTAVRKSTMTRACVHAASGKHASRLAGSVGFSEALDDSDLSKRQLAFTLMYYRAGCRRRRISKLAATRPRNTPARYSDVGSSAQQPP